MIPHKLKSAVENFLAEVENNFGKFTGVTGQAENPPK